MYTEPAFAERLRRCAAAARPFHELVHAATRAAGGPHRDHLGRIARTLAHAPELWRPIARHDPVARWYVHLLHTDALEVWLIGWEIGQDIQLHDHGRSSGAVAVCDGVLDEQHTQLGRRGPLRARQHDRTATFSFGPSYVHNLGNTGPRPATSVHVYAPPLARMTFYEHSEAGMRPVRSVPVTGPDPGVPRRTVTGDLVAS